MKEICRETLERAYLILDGERITDTEKQQIEAHLHACEPCYARYGIEQDVKRIISRLRGSEVCPAELKTRIAGLLHDG